MRLVKSIVHGVGNVEVLQVVVGTTDTHQYVGQGQRVMAVLWLLRCHSLRLLIIKGCNHKSEGSS